MATQPEVELELLDQRPQQFGLIHLMGLTGGLALASALLVPILRKLPIELVAILLAILLGELSFVIGHWITFATRRKNVLAVAGRRISDGSEDKRNTRPKKLEFMVVIGVEVLVAQIGIGSAAYLLGASEAYWVIIMCEIQIALFVAHRISRRWNCFDDRIVFFEHGIVRQSFEFIPWERVVVRPSQLYDDSANLHIESTTRHTGPTLETVPVSTEMKRYLLKHHGEKELPTQAARETV